MGNWIIKTRRVEIIIEFGATGFFNHEVVI